MKTIDRRELQKKNNNNNKRKRNKDRKDQGEQKL